MTLVRPGARVNTENALGNHEGRVRDLERLPKGRWIYVGDYPSDPDTTPDSPPFENSWINNGGGDRRLRFRRDNEGNTQIAGSVTGGAAGTVVTTLPELYRMSEDEYAVGMSRLDTTLILTGWLFATDGTLTMLGSLSFDGGSSDLDALHWGTNTDDDEEGLTLDAQTPGQNINIYGDSLLLDADSDITINFDGLLGAFGGATSEINLIAASTGWQIEPAIIFAQMDTGAVFEIRDSAGDPVFRITDGVDDVHIKSGWSIVADL